MSCSDGPITTDDRATANVSASLQTQLMRMLIYVDLASSDDLRVRKQRDRLRHRACGIKLEKMK